MRDGEVNAAQVDGMTALHWAVHHDDLATCESGCLAAHAKFESGESLWGHTALARVHEWKCRDGHAPP